MTQLEEIAQASHSPYNSPAFSIFPARIHANFRTQFADIIYIIDKRLNDHGKNWRHVYKTLVVLEYCICCGADSMVTYSKERLYEIRTLREFMSLDDHGNDNGACVREKSKDIVNLLSDDNLLSESRRNRSPPFERRPSSTGPLTIAPDPAKRPSLAGSGALMGKSYPAARSATSRRSFEDLQNMDEETAMTLALQESKVEFESAQDSMNQKDSGFPAFLQNFSRSSSARSSQVDLSSKTGQQPLSADQLLDLDDESFANALDSSYLGSRRESSQSRLDNLLSANGTNVDNNRHAQTAADPFSGSYIPFMMSNNGHEPTQYVENPFEGFQTASTDPFMSTESCFDQFGHEARLQDSSLNKTQNLIHPIALPGNTMPELNLGAKPVMPGSMAPQFGSKPSHQAFGLDHNSPATLPVPQNAEKNAPSFDNDPFADLV